MSYTADDVTIRLVTGREKVKAFYGPLYKQTVKPYIDVVTAAQRSENIENPVDAALGLVKVLETADKLDNMAMWLLFSAALEITEADAALAKEVA